MSSTDFSYWNGVPVKYRRNARREWEQRRRHRAVLRLLGKVHGEVLDYGCGYGDLTYRMSQTHRVQGVDVDAGRIAFASREYSPIHFGICPADHLDFPDASFDILTSVVVIHFVPNPLRYLHEAYRVLRDNGHLIIACQNEPVVRNCVRRIVGKEVHSSGVSRQRLTALLSQAGFAQQAEACYYDPPFEGWKNAGDIFLGAVDQVLSLLRIRRTCSYYAVLARKVPIT